MHAVDNSSHFVMSADLLYQVQNLRLLSKCLPSHGLGSFSEVAGLQVLLLKSGLHLSQSSPSVL